MSITIPKDTLIVVADGTKATLFRNIAANGIEIQSDQKLSQDFLHQKGAAPLPTETSPGEADEAVFAKSIADNLYKQVHAGNVQNVVLIADPQTLGQIRPSLHKEVVSRIICELPKTLTNSSISDIEKTLKAA